MQAGWSGVSIPSCELHGAGARKSDHVTKMVGHADVLCLISPQICDYPSALS
jgi:hypothetical protein